MYPRPMAIIAEPVVDESGMGYKNITCRVTDEVSDKPAKAPLRWR